MRRVPIQIDEKTYAALKRRAFEENRSIASLIRESLSGFLMESDHASVEDFPFVGAGRSRQGSLTPVSERHDQALAAAYGRRRKK
jgi:hypothetical protein